MLHNTPGAALSEYYLHRQVEDSTRWLVEVFQGTNIECPSSSYSSTVVENSTHLPFLMRLYSICRYLLCAISLDSPSSGVGSILGSFTLYLPSGSRCMLSWNASTAYDSSTLRSPSLPWTSSSLQNSLSSSWVGSFFAEAFWQVVARLGAAPAGLSQPMAQPKMVLCFESVIRSRKNIIISTLIAGSNSQKDIDLLRAVELWVSQLETLQEGHPLHFLQVLGMVTICDMVHHMSSRLDVVRYPRSPRQQRLYNLSTEPVVRPSHMLRVHVLREPQLFFFFDAEDHSLPCPSV